MKQQQISFEEKLSGLNDQLDEIITKAKALEYDYGSMIAKVHPSYHECALNLTHYLAFGSFNIDVLQEELRFMGLPDLANIEGHVMKSLLAIKTIINLFRGHPVIETQKGIISIKESAKLLNKNTRRLFGYKSKKRQTRIMVTMPATAADDYSLVNHLVNLGMNSARINCAHDGPEVWAKMIQNIYRAKDTLNKVRL